MKLWLCSVGFLMAAGTADAECTSPNPSWPLVANICLLPMLGMNNAAPLADARFVGSDLNFQTIYAATGTTDLSGPVHMLNYDQGTNKTGTAKISGLTIDDSFGGGSSGEGNRNAIFAHLNQIGPTPYTSGNYHYHTGVFSWMDIGASDASASGQYFGFGGLAESRPGHDVNLTQLKGAELDTSIKAGSTASYMATLSLALVNSHAVRGSVFDAALAIEKDGSSPQTYKTGISLGSNFATWPFAEDSTLMSAWDGAGEAFEGVDLHNVRFKSCAFHSAIFCVRDISGTLELKSNFPALSFSDTQIAEPFTHGGLIRFRPDGGIADTYEYQINTAGAGDFSTRITSFSINSSGTLTALRPLVVNGTLIQNQISPPSSYSTCTTGAIAWDAGYIYVCTGPNTWKRAALSTW